MQADNSGDQNLVASDRNHASSLVGDCVNTYIKIMSNPVCFALLIVSSYEFLLLLQESPSSFYDFVVTAANEAAGPSPPDYIKAIIQLLTRFASTFNKYRTILVSFYITFIPVVMNERDYVFSVLVSLFLYIFTINNLLQSFVYSHIWLQFSNLSYTHRVVLVVVSFFVFYYDIVDLKSSGTICKTLVSTLKGKGNT